MLFSSTITLPNAGAAMPSLHIGYPPPTLTPSENQAIIDTAMGIPELQNWSHNWQFVDMSFLGNNKAGTPDFKWQYAIVDLKAPSSSAPVPCSNDWWAWIEIDMTTMKIVRATYPTMESHNCNYVTTGPDIPHIQADAISRQKQINNTQQPGTPAYTESPLKQIRSGILVKNVICNEGLQLIIKAEDNSPACVRPDTAQKLMERGWTKESISTVRTTTIS